VRVSELPEKARAGTAAWLYSNVRVLRPLRNTAAGRDTRYTAHAGVSTSRSRNVPFTYTLTVCNGEPG
jgi:hypothetical protein